MKITDFKDGIIIYRLIETNIKNMNNTMRDYNDMNEAICDCIKLMKTTPETIIYHIQTIIKPTHGQYQTIGIMTIPREFAE